MTTMKEAFEKANLVPSRADRPPEKRWWQHFRMTLTTFEIPVFVKVQCEKWADGMKIIRDHKLNYVTTRCKTEDEARLQLKRKLQEWDSEHILTAGGEPPEGALLYWRVY